LESHAARRGGEMHVYLITDLKTGKCYVGAEKNGNNPEYYGSSREIYEIRKRLGEKEFKKRFKKEILIDNISSQEELNEIESYFIMGLDALAPNGYNKKIYQWPPPAEACGRGGERVHELHPEEQKEWGRKGGRKVHELHPEEQKEWGRKGGKKAAETNMRQKTAIFAPGMQSKGGKIGGKIGGKRVHELYPEEMKEWSRKGAETNRRNGTGIHAPENLGKGGKKTHELHPDEQKEWGRRGAETTMRQGTGLFDPANKEKCREGNRKGGKIAGPLTAHVLFEIDGILQMTTLGRILNWM